MRNRLSSNILSNLYNHKQIRKLKEDKEVGLSVRIDNNDNINTNILSNLKESITPSRKLLKESDEIRVFMNTWNNYNEYGADEGNTPTGWMSIDDAIEYCKKYSEYEPFINDVDNCPIEVSEYDNASAKLEELKKLEDTDVDKDVLAAFIEEGSYKNIDDILEKIESGDYIFFSGVNDDYDLGRAYFDMAGIDSISDQFQYCDIKRIMEEYRDNDSEDNDLSEDDYYAMADERIENERIANNMNYAEEYFDYEALGRDLSFDYTYTSTGALCSM